MKIEIADMPNFINTCEPKCITYLREIGGETRFQKWAQIQTTNGVILTAGYRSSLRGWFLQQGQKGSEGKIITLDFDYGEAQYKLFFEMMKTLYKQYKKKCRSYVMYGSRFALSGYKHTIYDFNK